MTTYRSQLFFLLGKVVLLVWLVLVTWRRTYCQNHLLFVVSVIILNMLEAILVEWYERGMTINNLMGLCLCIYLLYGYQSSTHLIAFAGLYLIWNMMFTYHFYETPFVHGMNLFSILVALYVIWSTQNLCDWAFFRAYTLLFVFTMCLIREWYGYMNKYPLILSI